MIRLHRMKKLEADTVSKEKCLFEELSAYNPMKSHA